MNRISSQLNNNNTQSNLRLQEIKRANVENQIGTQSRISQLRDDPLAAGHLVRYESYLSRVNQFEKNAATLADQFQVREGYLNQNLQIIQRVRELAINGANGVNTPDDLKIMSIEVNELLKELVQNANAIGPDGNSLFAGTSTKTRAFDVFEGSVPGSAESLITEVRYNGNNESVNVEVDENEYLSFNNSGSKNFWAERQQLIASRDASSWQASDDAKISVDGKVIDINSGDNVYALISKINGSGASVKASLDPITNGLNLETTDARQLWLEDKSGSTLQDLGLIKDNGQKPPYNIGNSVRLSGGSLFDAVIAVRDSMLNGDSESLGGRVLGVLDNGLKNLTTRLSEVGSIYERCQNNIQRSTLNELNVTKLVSREGDIDFTKAVIDMKKLQYVNQATMSNAAKMYSSTLLNYMR